MEYVVRQVLRTECQGKERRRKGVPYLGIPNLSRDLAPKAFTLTANSYTACHNLS